MTVFGRRAALKRLGMGAAMAPMMPAAVAKQMANGAAPIGAGAVSAIRAPDYRPWDMLGLPKKLWQAMDRERDERNARRHIYREALLGVVECDIAGLHSLSPAAKARMQRDRVLAAREADERDRLRIWPQLPEDDE